ncbi:MAG: PIG-L deacetylase family protein [Actinomycetota bacterium]|nr:PIG-L deacetylase family protein [Actinomycetota bacterium]
MSTDQNLHDQDPQHQDPDHLSTRQLGTILSIWAHPDDETYLAGGLMAAARDGGQRVVCASATAGEHGTDDPRTWPPDRLGAVRRWEATAAMAVLGVDEHHVADLPDGGLDAHDEVGVAWAGGLLDTVRADTILTFGPDGMTYHPDHIAVHRWVTRAWRDRGRPGRLLYAATSEVVLDRFGELFEEWDMYMSDERPTGVPSADLAVDLHLAGWQLDRKLTALRAMATQTAGLIAALDPELYAAQVAPESFLAAPADDASSATPTAQRSPAPADTERAAAS